jgi:hypothetical protein
MTLCPVAIVVGCKKCPAFAVCPLKSTLGDYMKEPEHPERRTPDKSKAGAKRAR